MKSIMNESIIEKDIRLIDNVYIKEEKLLESKIKNNFYESNSNYISTNTSKLDDKEFLIKEKFKILSLIHENNSIVLKHALKNYITTSENVARSFNELNK